MAGKAKKVSVLTRYAEWCISVPPISCSSAMMRSLCWPLGVVVVSTVFGGERFVDMRVGEYLRGFVEEALCMS